jgi:hypothetical protein
LVALARAVMTGTEKKIGARLALVGSTVSS